MNLSAPEIIAIVLVILLLFGAKRLPDTARALGQSLKIFKKSVRDDEDEKRGSPGPVPPPQITALGEPRTHAQPAQPTPVDETKRVQP
jgi:sec-independent protein translocase protein TatA